MIFIRKVDRDHAPGHRARHRIPTDLLLKAYASGVFPDGGECRGSGSVLGANRKSAASSRSTASMYPQSLRKTIRRRHFDIRFDTDFAGVIDACAETMRDGRQSTWINAPIREAYTANFEPDRPLPLGRSLARRPAGRRPLRGLARPRLLRRKHVFARDRRLQGLPRPSGGAAQGARGFLLLDTQFTTEHLKALRGRRRAARQIREDARQGAPRRSHLHALRAS
jgi:leucyl/phenylalanyl-tRNA--protein transferase